MVLTMVSLTASQLLNAFKLISVSYLLFSYQSRRPLWTLHRLVHVILLVVLVFLQRFAMQHQYQMSRILQPLGDVRWLPKIRERDRAANGKTVL